MQLAEQPELKWVQDWSLFFGGSELSVSLACLQVESSSNDILNEPSSSF